MATCDKKPYATEWAARIALRAVGRRYAAQGRSAPRGVHLCLKCGGGTWHLTSSKGQTAPWRRTGAAQHGISETGPAAFFAFPRLRCR